MDNDKEKEKRKKKEGAINSAITGAAYEDIQRYGDAAKQHYAAYSGIDNEAGKALSKGLKQIAKEKVNEEYEFQNIHQQAGFSAEVKDVARSNAENIIHGDPVRKIRTDDLGRVNDPLYDTVLLDINGDIIEGSGAQMKFLGASERDPKGVGDSKRALEKLQQKKFEKYLEHDAKIVVPSDQYDQIIEEAKNKIENLSRQLDNQKKAGNEEQVQNLQKRIAKLEKIRKNLRKSSVSSKEAVFAREHPVLSTAGDVAQLSHRAGLQTAANAVKIGGSVSIVQNLVSVCKGETEPEDAVLNVAKDTVSTAALGYGTGAAGAALKGAMQNARSNTVQAISKTNVPGTIVAVTVTASKTLARYFKGEIDGLECLEVLGEQGTGMIASSMFAVVGQAAIPVPIVGAMIGSMVDYFLKN